MKPGWREREGEGKGGHENLKRAPLYRVQKLAQILPGKAGRDSELDPVQRGRRKRHQKDARFGAHFTQMYRFPAVST
jgi:hypothetical protein